MESIFYGMNHVCVYIDATLVSGETESKHLINLQQVLARLEAADLRLKGAKYAVMLPSVDYMYMYLGHTVTSKDFSPQSKRCML